VIKPYRIAAILGLDCGRRVYDLLAMRSDVELVAVFGKTPEASQGVAGYLDLSTVVPTGIFHGYAELSEISESFENLGYLDAVIALGISEIVREPILSAGKRGCFGVHAARLPERPGCSPIVWAILDGLTETAVTLFRMDERIDAGRIYDMEPISIADHETAGDIRTKCDAGIITMLDRSLGGILSGKIKGRLQGDGPRHYTRKRSVKDGELDLSASARSIVRKVNALALPYPGAHFYAGDGQAVVIEKARLGDKALSYERTSARRKVLCVVAHPDDEALGVGGTLIRHAQRGDRVEIVIVSEGESAKSADSPMDPDRQSKAQAWCDVTGCILRACYGFPDQRLDVIPMIEVIHKLEKDITEFQPDIIYTHHPGDMNTDHRVVAQALLAAVRPMTGRSRATEILAFETPSSTDQAPNTEPYIFMPTHYVSVTGVWEKKMVALQVYANELRSAPHPRSPERIKARAMTRGTESGSDLAEAFVVLRHVWWEES